MKNHFVFSYQGNKREEVEQIYKHLDLSNIETIIEIFCGSSSISYYISLENPLKFKYILNDNNKLLIDLYLILKDKSKTDDFEKKINEICSNDNFNKETYKNLDINTIEGYFIKNKINAIRPGLWDLSYKYKYINLNDYPIINFLRTENITFLNNDAIECYEKYKDNEKNLLILDPPYFSSCNQFYRDFSFNIYKYLYDNDINNEKANIYLTLENIWIIDLLFKNKKKIIYDKKYLFSKKKTTHIIILNK